MKYYIKTLTETRTVVEYEIEVDSLQDAKDIAYDLDEEEGNVIWDDCSDFEILEARQID